MRCNLKVLKPKTQFQIIVETKKNKIETKKKRKEKEFEVDQSCFDYIK